MKSSGELLSDPKVVGKLSDAVTHLQEKDCPEAAAFLAVIIQDPRASDLWAHMEECVRNGWV